MSSTLANGQLNSVLAFCGMSVGDDGKVRRVSTATDLADAIARTDRLHQTLATRKVHADVLKFCRAELLEKNYFHVVFEAMKSIDARLPRIKLDNWRYHECDRSYSARNARA
jgi:hypothetical protein